MAGQLGALVVVVAAMAVATTSGCSVVWIEHVPKKPLPGERIRCTLDRSAPILDSLLTATASAAAIGSGVALRKENAHCSRPESDCGAPNPAIVLYGAGIVAAAVFAAAFAASATYGFVHTTRCSALRVRGVAPERSALLPAATRRPADAEAD
jgi:hypothetical protein